MAVTDFKRLFFQWQEVYSKAVDSRLWSSCSEQGTAWAQTALSMQGDLDPCKHTMYEIFGGSSLAIINFLLKVGRKRKILSFIYLCGCSPLA